MVYRKNTKTTAGQLNHLAYLATSTAAGAIKRKLNGGCTAYSDGSHRYRGPNHQCKCGSVHK